jgi:hypothetical protein
MGLLDPLAIKASLGILSLMAVIHPRIFQMGRPLIAADLE